MTRVNNTPLKTFDDHGLGLEENNLAAINSLKTYRAFRYGKNVEMILTDNRSHQSESIALTDVLDPFDVPGFPGFSDELNSSASRAHWNAATAPTAVI